MTSRFDEIFGISPQDRADIDWLDAQLAAKRQREWWKEPYGGAASESGWAVANEASRLSETAPTLSAQLPFDRFGGDSDACLRGFDKCHLIAQQLWDRGYRNEASALFLGCQQTDLLCRQTDRQVQIDPKNDRGITRFPPARERNGGGYVVHSKGARPFYVEPSYDFLADYPPRR